MNGIESGTATATGSGSGCPVLDMDPLGLYIVKGS